MLKKAWKAIVLVAAGVSAAGAALAEPIKIGTVRTGIFGPLFIAVDNGYFADAGVPAELVFFESPQPVAVAAVAGAIDFGVAGTTAGFYSLAGQGGLRIIAGAGYEAPGFKSMAYLVSRRAYDAGLTSLKDFPGHSFALAQVGSTAHYALGLLADKYRFDIHSLRILALQSIPNSASALAGGQADVSTISQAPSVLAGVERGDIKRLGWVGDETPFQLGFAFTSRRAADERGDTVRRFLAAYRRGVATYHAAFVGADGKPAEGPAAPELLAIMAKRLGQSTDQVKLTLAYYDAEARLDVPDVLHQVAWFKSQGLLKGDVDGEAIIDNRYVVPLAKRLASEGPRGP